MIKLADSYRESILKGEIKRIIKDKPGSKVDGIVLRFKEDKSIFLDIEFFKLHDNDCCRVKWVQVVDDSYHNEDFMYFGNDYKILKSKIINYKEVI